MMDWEGFGRKRLWPNLRYYLSICLEGLIKTTKNLRPDSRSPGRDLNPGPPEYEGVLTDVSKILSALIIIMSHPDDRGSKHITRRRVNLISHFSQETERRG
jgi:hypothetical protein